MRSALEEIMFAVLSIASWPEKLSSDRARTSTTALADGKRFLDSASGRRPLLRTGSRLTSATCAIAQSIDNSASAASALRVFVLSNLESRSLTLDVLVSNEISSIIALKRRRAKIGMGCGIPFVEIRQAPDMGERIVSEQRQNREAAHRENTRPRWAAKSGRAAVEG